MKSFPGARHQKLPEKPCWPWQNEVSLASAHLTWGGCFKEKHDLFLNIQKPTVVLLVPLFWKWSRMFLVSCCEWETVVFTGRWSQTREALWTMGTGYWDAFGLVCPASNSSLNSPFRSALVLSNSRGKHQALLEMIIVVRAVQSPAPPVRKSKCLNTNVLLMTRSEPPGPSFNTSSSGLYLCCDFPPGWARWLETDELPVYCRWRGCAGSSSSHWSSAPHWSCD